MPRLGAHVSTAGGVSTAFPRAAELGCDALQVFVKNANAWRAKPLPTAEIDAFRAAHAGTPGPSAPAPLPLVAHAGYLINLCSPKADVHEKSREALIDELERCTALGVPGLVLHPGAHLGTGEDEGLDGIARALDAVHAALPDAGARVLLENTAGQGTVLGSRLEQLAAIVARVDAPERVGVCLDTCHAFAAGYDLRDDDGYAAFVDEVARTVTLERVAAVHLNDSRFGVGSHKDRHASIGEGELGRETFARWLADARWGDVPMVLETPLGDDGLGHARDLATLRAL
ncbi:MAG: deoxyribonuclease IV [Trueperaceae bacterium]|nr:deoxyribonuclease IV [Trueperaceae bacterium]